MVDGGADPSSLTSSSCLAASLLSDGRAAPQSELVPAPVLCNEEVPSWNVASSPYAE